MKAVLAALGLAALATAGIFAVQNHRQAQCREALSSAAGLRLQGKWAESEAALAPLPACARSDAGRMEHARWLLGQGRVVPAAAAFAEEMKRQPRKAEAWASWGYTQALLGKRDDAERALERAQLLNPDEPQVKARLAELRGR